MQISDFWRMITDLESRSPEHALMLLNAPTGTGKSYTIAQALCQYAADHENFRAFFVTDQKKNFNEHTFKAAWNKHARSSCGTFNQRVAILRSLEDTVNKIIGDWDNQQMPAKYRSSESVRKVFKNLKMHLGLFQAYKHQAADSQTSWEALRKAEFEFRQAITVQLADSVELTVPLDDEGQKKACDYVAKQVNSETKWLNETYPTIDLYRRQIIILTTAKFTRSYTPFFQEHAKSFQFAPIIHNALIVMDEFDSTKQQVLDKAIDDALKIQADLIMLFEALHQGFKKMDEDVLPSQLRDCFTARKQFNVLKEEGKQLRSKFALRHLYKTEAVSLDSGFVIHTPQRQLISAGKPWHAYLDHHLKQVVLGQQARDDLHFQRMLPRVYTFLRRTTRFFRDRARDYQGLKNSEQSNFDDAMTIDDACHSIYNALGLSGEQIKVLLSLGHDYSSAQGIKSNYHAHSAHRFQQQGLSLFQMMNDYQHEFQTDIDASFFKVTPERYLLNLLNKANILGLSATATLPTVLDNYDLTYLREMLGPRMINGIEFLSAETQEELDFEGRYAKGNIQVNAEMANIGTSFASIFENRLKQNGLVIESTIIRQLDAALEKKANAVKNNEQEGGSGKDYFKQRYIALFDSFVVFLTDPMLTSFLGLQSLLPGKEQGGMDQEYLSVTFDRLKELLTQQFTEAADTKLKIISPRNGENVQSDLAEALAIPSHEDKRVYILSAYQTVGVGQNLQHVMNEFEREHAVNIAPKGANSYDLRHESVDLAGIYLGDVTHILTNTRQFRMDASGLRAIIEREYLFDTYEINVTTLNTFFTNLERGRWQAYPKNARSLYVSYSRTIIQALGRMNRAFNKMPCVRILASANVLGSITGNGIDLEETSFEYRRLLDYADEKAPTFEKTRSEAFKQNATLYTHRDLLFLKSHLQTNEQDAEYYRDLRLFVAKHPTASEEERIGNAVFKRRNDESGFQYLPAEKHETKYEVKPDTRDSGCFDFSKIGMEISAEASGLTIMCRYPGLKTHFEDLEIPTEWLPNELILNPVQYRNLYRGQIGEVAGQFIFEKEWRQKLQDFDDLANNELFDFQCQGEVAIDFKNWQGQPNKDTEKERQHVAQKLRHLQVNTGREWRVIIANVVAINKGKPTITIDGKILEISGLIDEQGKLVLTPEQKIQIGRFLHARPNDNSDD